MEDIPDERALKYGQDFNRRSQWLGNDTLDELGQGEPKL